MNYTQLSIERIKVSPYQDRFSHEIPSLLGNERLQDMPVTVVYSKETGQFIITKNVAVFLKLESEGAKKISCIVASIVETDADAYAQRTAYVLEEKRPFHILEQCRCIHQCQEDILMRDGEDNFYSNGGDRRSDKYKKESILEKIIILLPYKKSQVDIMKRFGRNVGVIGIEGLYKILVDEKRGLTIHLIHKKNAELELADIIVQTKSLERQGKNQEEIKSTIGKVIYDILFGIEIADEDGDSVEEIQFDNGETQEKEHEIEHPPINPSFGPLSESGTKKVKSSIEKCFEDFVVIHGFLAAKTCLNEEDSAIFENQILDLQKSLTAFIVDYHREKTKW